MEKRKMLTFSIPAQLLIETASCFALLVFSWKLSGGVTDGSQSRTGACVLLGFAVLFALGGILGLVKTARKYRNYQKEKGR